MPLKPDETNTERVAYLRESADVLYDRASRAEAEVASLRAEIARLRERLTDADAALESSHDACTRLRAEVNEARGPVWGCFSCGNLSGFRTEQHPQGDYDVYCNACGSAETDEAATVTSRLVNRLDSAEAECDEARETVASLRAEVEAIRRTPLHETWLVASREVLLDGLRWQGAVTKALMEDADRLRAEVERLREEPKGEVVVCMDCGRAGHDDEFEGPCANEGDHDTQCPECGWGSVEPVDRLRADLAAANERAERAEAFGDAQAKARLGLATSLDAAEAALVKVTREVAWERQKRAEECSYCGCLMAAPRHEPDCPVSRAREAEARLNAERLAHADAEAETERRLSARLAEVTRERDDLAINHRAAVRSESVEIGLRERAEAEVARLTAALRDADRELRWAHGEMRGRAPQHWLDVLTAVDSALAGSTAALDARDARMREEGRREAAAWCDKDADEWEACAVEREQAGDMTQAIVATAARDVARALAREIRALAATNRGNPSAGEGAEDAD